MLREPSMIVTGFVRRAVGGANTGAKVSTGCWFVSPSRSSDVRIMTPFPGRGMSTVRPQVIDLFDALRAARIHHNGVASEESAYRWFARVVMGDLEPPVFTAPDRVDFMSKQYVDVKVFDEVSD